MDEDKADGGKGNSFFIRKWVMRQYWRLQQSQAFISLGFWATTLTLLIWPFVRWRFDEGAVFLSVPITYWGIVFVFISVITLVLTVGFTYDRVFGLWNEWRTVDTERNPYATHQLMPPQMVLMGLMNETLRRIAPDDKEVQKTCEWVSDWLERSTKEELFARAFKGWEDTMQTDLPELCFLPEGVIPDRRRELESGRGKE